MKFFKKTSVAILLTALLVALCCVWGYSRAYEASHSDPDSVVQSQRPGRAASTTFSTGLMTAPVSFPWRPPTPWPETTWT